MSKIKITEESSQAFKGIQSIAHYVEPETNSYAIERLGAIIACAEFERELLKDIQKGKPEIVDGLKGESVTFINHSHTNTAQLIKLKQEPLDGDITQ